MIILPVGSSFHFHLLLNICENQSETATQPHNVNNCIYETGYSLVDTLGQVGTITIQWDPTDNRNLYPLVVPALVMGPFHEIKFLTRNGSSIKEYSYDTWNSGLQSKGPHSWDREHPGYQRPKVNLQYKKTIVFLRRLCSQVFSVLKVPPAPQRYSTSFSTIKSTRNFKRWIWIRMPWCHPVTPQSTLI